MLSFQKFENVGWVFGVAVKGMLRLEVCVFEFQCSPTWEGADSDLSPLVLATHWEVWIESPDFGLAQPWLW